MSISVVVKRSEKKELFPRLSLDDLAEKVQRGHADVCRHLVTAQTKAFELGGYCLAAKQKCVHGEFGDWKKKVGIPESSITFYMAVAKRKGELSADLWDKLGVVKGLEVAKKVAQAEAQSGPMSDEEKAEFAEIQAAAKKVLQGTADKVEETPERQIDHSPHDVTAGAAIEDAFVAVREVVAGSASIPPKEKPVLREKLIALRDAIVQALGVL